MSCILAFVIACIIHVISCIIPVVRVVMSCTVHIMPVVLYCRASLFISCMCSCICVVHSGICVVHIMYCSCSCHVLCAHIERYIYIYIYIYVYMFMFHSMAEPLHPMDKKIPLKAKSRRQPIGGTPGAPPAGREDRPMQITTGGIPPRSQEKGWGSLPDEGVWGGDHKMRASKAIISKRMWEPNNV